jgi:hypothetical protein
MVPNRCPSRTRLCSSSYPQQLPAGPAIDGNCVAVKSLTSLATVWWLNSKDIAYFSGAASIIRQFFDSITPFRT